MAKVKKSSFYSRIKRAKKEFFERLNQKSLTNSQGEQNPSGGVIKNNQTLDCSDYSSKKRLGNRLADGFGLANLASDD